MANRRHSNDDDHTLPSKAGGHAAQGIVDLVSSTDCGLVFWSRHPFEVAAELLLRLNGEAIPPGVKPPEGWLMKRGLVVACQPGRRADGSVGFEVSVLFVPATLSATKKPARTPCGHQIDPELVRKLCGLN